VILLAGCCGRASTQLFVRSKTCHVGRRLRTWQWFDDAGMCEGQGAPPHLQAVQDTAQADRSPLLQRNVAAAYTCFLSPQRSSELASLPSSPPTTPPHSCPKGRPVPRSPTKNALRVQGVLRLFLQSSLLY
jgi:hypothetical protein